MKVAILSLFLLFSFVNSCNSEKEDIKLTQENHLTERQLHTIYTQNNDERYENTSSLDSIPIGGGDPLPPCPDPSFTDCCPSLKYLSFNSSTQSLIIELLDKNGEVVQTFTKKDLKTTKTQANIFSLKKLNHSICNGKYTLRVTVDKKKPYEVGFN